MEYKYAGFGVRLLAALIDTALYAAISLPVLLSIYDNFWDSDQWFLGWWDFLLTWLLPLVATVIFWVYRSATPGKMVLKLSVLDADSGQPLSTGKAVLRYLAYYISALPFCLGYIWIIFSPKKQGWHDLIANSVVVEPAKDGVSTVEFLRAPNSKRF